MKSKAFSHLFYSLNITLFYLIVLLSIAKFMFVKIDAGTLTAFFTLNVIALHVLLIDQLGYGKAFLLSFTFFLIASLVFGIYAIFPYFCLNCLLAYWYRRKWLLLSRIKPIKNMIIDYFSIFIFAFLTTKMLLLRAPSHADPNSFVMHLLLGTIGQDQIFDMSIASMIKEYYFPSTGLHGIPLYNGSYLGHIVLAALSKATGYEVYEIYSYITPYFAFPLLLFAICYFLKNRQLYLLPLIIFGLYLSLNHPWLGFDISALYGYIFLMTLVIMIHNNESEWFLGILVFLAFWAKFNIGLILFGMSSYFYLIKFWSKKKFLLSYLLILSLILISSYILFYPVFYDQTGAWNWWYYYSFLYREPFNFASMFEFIWGLLSLPILYAIIVSTITYNQGLAWLKKHHFSIILVGGMFIASFIAIHLVNVSNSNIHFFQLSQFMTVPFLIKSIKDLNLNKKSQIFFAIVFTLSTGYNLKIIAYQITNFDTNHKLAFKEFISSHDPNLLGHEDQKVNAFKIYWDAFKKIEKETPKNYLVEIPENDSLFWNHCIFRSRSVRHWMPFYIPILAKRPMWKGYNKEFMYKTSVAWYPPGFYGYNVYYRQDVADICNETKFEGITRVLRTEDNQIKLEAIPCKTNI